MTFHHNGIDLLAQYADRTVTSVVTEAEDVTDPDTGDYAFTVVTVRIVLQPQPTTEN